jgi:spore germination cell wall hydrolase CwlJ-like protein
MRIIADAALGSMAIWAEAEGEPYEGKCAVGEVIRRRTAQKYFSDGTVASTLAWPYQFSFFNMDKNDRARLIKMLQLDDSPSIMIECRKAWTESAISNLSGGALGYYNPKAVVTTPTWAQVWHLTVEIGNHRFYGP